MALFKISKGLKANLPSAKTAGNCWYTIDDSLFYIDYEDTNGEVQRKALNAKDAETLTGASLSTILNSSDIEIPTSAAVLSALAGKADKVHNHNDTYYTESEIDEKLSPIESHISDSDIHVTTANKTNWTAAYTHSQAVHARTDATKVADSTTNGNILING